MSAIFYKDKVYGAGGGGGGGGSTVTITPTLSTGTKIAEFEIDGTAGELYAPHGGGGAIDYSTTEQNTGQKWIDGKTIYQKTVKIESINMGENYALSLGISNIDNIMIDMAGSFLYKDSQSTAIWPLPNVHHIASNIVGVWFSKDTGYANFRIGSSSRGVVSGAITVRYTKTTD